MTFAQAAENATLLFKTTAARGGRLFFIGNGGSAAIAGHMATDYTKNGGMPSLAFNDASLLTCFGNDFGYENVFAKAIEYHGRAGDTLIAISSSGRSPSILNAVNAARKLGCDVVTLSGFSPDNPLRDMGDINFHVENDRYGLVEVSPPGPHPRLAGSLVDGDGRPGGAAQGRMTDMNRTWNVLVTGGAGYVGSVLVPKLLEAGHKVTVLDLFIYGDDVLNAVAGHPSLRLVKGDLRDPTMVADALTGCDAVIHLACISNDPSFELNPDLGRSINHDAFRPLVRAAKATGVRRFVYASSSSVYGVKVGVEVTEDLSLEPLTDYSKYKALCEAILEEEREPGFTTLTVRPATVCGYSPRQRLDVIVNILTNHAVNNGRVKVFGGAQLRPNLHIDDMADFYSLSLALPDEAIDGKVYNVGDENHSVMELAEIVRGVVGAHVGVDVAPTDDPRSYHVSSARVLRELGFAPKRSIEGAVRDLVAAFAAGRLPNSMTDPRYYNIRTMQRINLT